MDNHLHLVLERGPVALSRIMRTLQSSYAQKFNRRHRRVGHLFQGRYKAFLVQHETHLLALVRYVHMNPVSAAIVARPEAKVSRGQSCNPAFSVQFRVARDNPR
jgi:putative transposase